MFAEADLTTRRFSRRGRLRILQPAAGYRAAMDPVLLAAAVPAQSGQDVLELGCGTGVASLCLGARVSGLDPGRSGTSERVTLTLARRNAEANRQAMTVFEGDLGAPPQGLAGAELRPCHCQSALFCVPGRNACRGCRTRARAARGDAACRLDGCCAAPSSSPADICRSIQAAERLPDLLRALDDRAGAISVLPVAPRPGRPAGRVILRARKGARGASSRLLRPFVLHEGAAHLRDGDDLTPAARAILRDGAALDLLP